MTFSKTLISSLRQLIEGKSVAASSLRKDIASELLNEGLLTVTTHGSRRAYRAIEGNALKRYLDSKHEVFRVFGAMDEDGHADTLTRAVQAPETGNSKLVTVRSCPGFPVNSYEPIACRLNGKAFIVEPADGCFWLVADWKNFEIPEDVIVVGIENMENFRMIRQQRDFFEREISSDCPLLFVSRYPQSTDLRNWLQSIPNRYIHFGDFDLAGINIFLTEFYQHLNDRACFLIPSDIECRLQRGSIKRYDEQYSKFKNVHTDIIELQKLVDMINKLHRGYDQEGYIGS